MRIPCGFLFRSFKKAILGWVMIDFLELLNQIGHHPLVCKLAKKKDGMETEM